MNTTIAWGTLLLLASLTTVAAAAPDPPATANDRCEFIGFDDEFPFINVDPTCPPIPPRAVAGF